MPIYEYICKDCGVKFETIRSIKDANAAIPCQNCSGKNTHRALSTCFSKTSGGYSSSSSCGGCSGGNCSHCH